MAGLLRGSCYSNSSLRLSFGALSRPSSPAGSSRKVRAEACGRCQDPLGNNNWQLGSKGRFHLSPRSLAASPGRSHLRRASHSWSASLDACASTDLAAEPDSDLGKMGNTQAHLGGAGHGYHHKHSSPSAVPHSGYSHGTGYTHPGSPLQYAPQSDSQPIVGSDR